MTPYLSRIVVASAYAMHLHRLSFIVNMHTGSLIITRMTHVSVKCNISDCVGNKVTSKLVENTITCIYLFVYTYVDP